jgi:hypothetical protein
LEELNGISATFGFLSRIDATDPRDNSTNFNSALSLASPVHSLSKELIPLLHVRILLVMKVQKPGQNKDIILIRFKSCSVAESSNALKS